MAHHSKQVIRHCLKDGSMGLKDDGDRDYVTFDNEAQIDNDCYCIEPLTFCVGFFFFFHLLSPCFCARWGLVFRYLPLYLILLLEMFVRELNKWIILLSLDCAWAWAELIVLIYSADVVEVSGVFSRTCDLIVTKMIWNWSVTFWPTVTISEL